MSPSSRFTTLMLTLGLAAGLISPRCARADTTALGFLPGALGVEDDAGDTGADSYTLGYTFTLSAPVTVTALGVFTDPSFNPNTPFNVVPLSPENAGTTPLSQDHPVGVFDDATGALLFSATVPASGGTLLGDFLYAPVSGPATTLLPGTIYTIAAITGGVDPYVYDVQDGNGNAALTTASPVVYGQDRFTTSATGAGGAFVLSNPTSTDPGSEPGFLGPNFQFRTFAGAVPEPSSLALLVLALPGALLVRKSTQKGTIL